MIAPQKLQHNNLNTMLLINPIFKTPTNLLIEEETLLFTKKKMNSVGEGHPPAQGSIHKTNPTNIMNHQSKSLFKGTVNHSLLNP